MFWIGLTVLVFVAGFCVVLDWQCRQDEVAYRDYELRRQAAKLNRAKHSDVEWEAVYF